MKLADFIRSIVDETLSTTVEDHKRACAGVDPTTCEHDFDMMRMWCSKCGTTALELLEQRTTCHCGQAASRRDTGDIFQWVCHNGRCGFSKYEAKLN